jgi:hypothetical protein
MWRFVGQNDTGAVFFWSSTPVSSANSHFTDLSTLIYRLGLVQQAK